MFTITTATKDKNNSPVQVSLKDLKFGREPNAEKLRKKTAHIGRRSTDPKLGGVEKHYPAMTLKGNPFSWDDMPL